MLNEFVYFYEIQAIPYQLILERQQ